MIANAPQPGVLHFVSAPTAATSSRPTIGGTVPVYLCMRAIQEGLVPPGKVVLVGDEKSERSARSIGLIPHQRLTPPLGHVEMLTRAASNLASDCDRVFVWNDELAPLLKGIKAPTELISTRPDLARRRVPNRVSVRVFERQDRMVWESRNHEAELDTVLHHLVSNPNLDASTQTRNAFGISDNSICMGIIADRPSDIDARSIGFLMGLLDVSGFNLTAIIPENASHLNAARRHHHGLGDRFRFLIAQDPIITMLPIFDLLIHPCFNGSGASSLIERLCENMDTPVLRLHSGGRAGLSRAPGVAGPVVEAIDEIISSRSPAKTQSEIEIHA